MDGREAREAAKERRQRERAALESVEGALGQARLSLERARLAAGDRPCSTPLRALGVEASRVHLALAHELHKLPPD